MPGYLLGQDRLEDAGIDEVIIYCVNDGAVMQAWGEVMQKKHAPSLLITFMGDPNCEVTKALGLVIDHPGPVSKLGPNRCKRFAAYVVDGVVKALEVSEKEDDPAGDDFPESSSIENMLKVIEAVAEESSSAKRRKSE